ncbi:MAG: hypothetical protein ACLQPD_19260 [Desulfomonilaceae bacterium]
MESTTRNRSVELPDGQNAASGTQVKGRKSLFRKLLDLILARGLRIFLDDRGVAWGWAKLNGHYRTLNLRSDEFGGFCQSAYFSEYDDAISDGLIKKMASFLKHTATERHTLHNRFAYLDGELWIDTGKDGNAMVVTQNGWGTASCIVPVFRRFSHQKPFPVPEPDGSVKEILDFLPLKNPDDQLLILVWVCSLPLEHIQRPLLLLYGFADSGKSTCSETIRDIVDPSITATMSLPQSRVDLIQILDHHALPVFDNIERLAAWANPEICRAVTGGGFSKRTVFSEDGDSIFHFRRSAILNGINRPANAQDVLGRSIIIRLDPLTGQERALFGGRKELMRRFQEARSRIFGGILNVLSSAMRIRPTVKLEKLHRMDEWELWGCAIAQSLGISQEAFLHRYQANMSRQHEELVASDPVCLAVVQLMLARMEWQGSPSKLYSELSVLAKTEGHNRDATWPNAPNALTRRLNELKTSLSAVGIRVSQPRTTAQRTIILSRSESDSLQEAPASSSSEPTSSHEGNIDEYGDNDGFFSTGHEPSAPTYQ